MSKPIDPAAASSDSDESPPTSEEATKTALAVVPDGSQAHTQVASSLAGEWSNIWLLLALYTLQGIPIGLAVSVPMYMQSRGASFRDFGTFSLASYPYSLKLLWAPLVDALYTERFRLGQRKSWILPTQLLAGIIMLILGARIDSMFGGVPPEAGAGAAPAPGASIDVGGLTASFFVLYFLVATQDIAVDGWALTMLRPENVGYASTCNTVGQTAGVMLAYGVLMALDSADFANAYVRAPLGLPAASTGLVSMAGFMAFWGAAFIVFTLALWALKREAPVGSGSSSGNGSAGSGSAAGIAAGHFSHHSAEASSAGIGEAPVLAFAPTAGIAGASATPSWASVAAVTVTPAVAAASAVPADAVSASDSDAGIAARTRSRSSGRAAGRSRVTAVTAVPEQEKEPSNRAESAAAASATASATASRSGARRRNGSASPKEGSRRGSAAAPAAAASAAAASADARRKSRSSDAGSGAGGGSGSGSGDDAEAADHDDSETMPLRGSKQATGTSRATACAASSAAASAAAASFAAAPTLPAAASGDGALASAVAAPAPLSAWASVTSAYRDLWAVIRLRHVLTLALVMLTAKAGFAATDNATNLVMQGRGVSKQQIALLDVVSTPLQLAAQVAISRFTSGPRPMSLFMRAFPMRVAIGIAWLALIYGLLQQSQPPGSHSSSGRGASASSSPAGVSFPVLALIFLLSNAHSLVTGVMFIAQISFFTQVSDPALGGSYMTLLNTVANLGAKWPQYLTFRAMDALNQRVCAMPDGLTDASTCATDAEKAACSSAGGSCVTVRDGYAIMVAVGSVAALLWLVVMRRRVSQLESVPRAEWLLVK